MQLNAESFADVFQMPSNVSYLNCAYLGPQLRSVRTAAYETLQRRATPWLIRPSDFFDDSERLRSLFAHVLGTDTDGVALVPSVSYGLAIAANNLPVSAGQSIVVLEDQFPSNIYPWMELAARKQATIITIPRMPDQNIEQRVIAAIKENGAVCALEHCHWTDGTKLDLVPIAKACTESGCALVLDVTQSLGAIDFDYTKLKPAFVACAGYKWLLGPYGLSYLYVAPPFRSGIPIEHNWLNRAGSEDFRQLVHYRPEYQPGARRFDVGERSNILIPQAIAAMMQISEWGISWIDKELASRSLEIRSRCLKMGLTMVGAERRPSHILGIDWPHSPLDHLVTNLAKQNVFVSARGSRIRVSPHLYIGPIQIDQFENGLRVELGA